MVYRAIGIMSGSSLDGMDIVFSEFTENAGKWSYEIKAAACYDYPAEWKEKLQTAPTCNALEYQLLHSRYGHYIGEQVNRFIESNGIHYQVALIASHGHTSFHFPSKKLTAQLGDGAAIAATTGLPVVSDLRAMDIALGGQGAPIVPIGEKLLWSEYTLFLNLGGIANISLNDTTGYYAFDICPANRVLNMLAAEVGKDFDDDGQIAKSGNINSMLLEQLNKLDYYQKDFPKSLGNEFGTGVVYPIIKESRCSVPDVLRTFVEHIAYQIQLAVQKLKEKHPFQKARLLATGGGTLNSFLINRIETLLKNEEIELIIPDEQLINYKEALIMALIGILRWRQENTALSSVTGASRDSIGGALWNGHD